MTGSVTQAKSILFFYVQRATYKDKSRAEQSKTSIVIRFPKYQTHGVSNIKC